MIIFTLNKLLESLFLINAKNLKDCFTWETNICFICPKTQWECFSDKFEPEGGVTAAGHSEMTAGTVDSPQFSHPKLLNRWKKFSAKFSACVSPAFLLLPRSPSKQRQT